MGLRRDIITAKAVLAEFVAALGLPADAKFDEVLRFAKHARALVRADVDKQLSVVVEHKP